MVLFSSSLLFSSPCVWGWMGGVGGWDETIVVVVVVVIVMVIS